MFLRILKNLKVKKNNHFKIIENTVLEQYLLKTNSILKPDQLNLISYIKTCPKIFKEILILI